jgi:hypothetical protein
MYLARPLGSIALLATLIGVAGCAVDPYPPTVGDASNYSDGVPADVYAYPHVSYAGGYAYLVRNQWYYPSEGRWVLLRREPPTLYRYRVNYGQRSAPAYPGYPRGYDRWRYVPPTEYGYPRPLPPVR